MGSTSNGGNIYSCMAGWGGLTLTVPSVDNGCGATDVTGSSATLNGNLMFNGYVADNATVSIYWGAADGGTAAENWSRSASLGMRPLGAFSVAADNLTQSETYYYRCRATNAVGSAWSPNTYSFIAQHTQRLLGDNTTGAADAAVGYVVFEMCHIYRCCCRIATYVIISRILQSGGYIVPSYELVFILNANQNEDEITRTLGKVNDLITKLGGTVMETTPWGKRKLAYPIKRQAEGHYVLEKVQIKQTALKELDSNFKLADDILRYLFIRENS